jgi:hypothetical protein
MTFSAMAHARSIDDSARALAALPNLGLRSAQMLTEAGIRSQAALARTGAVGAYLRVKRSGGNASLNLLYALAGALDGTHWQQVRRQRKLELLTALEDRERAAGPRPRAAQVRSELQDLRNIGPAMARDFALLGVHTCKQLARADADRLYLKLQKITGRRHDPCVWDTFAAAIHQARSGEALPWWHFTQYRKAREAAGCFVPRFDLAARTAPRRSR